MRYLVTGGYGFIGSHLVEELLRRGHAVDVIDDLSTGRVENLAEVAAHPKLHCVVGSCATSPALADLVANTDAIFHLAASVGVKRVIETPVRTIETDLRSTESVLSLAHRYRKRVLVASSSEVYGKSQAVPFREDMDLVLGAPQRARWSYAYSKAASEMLAFGYWCEHRLPVSIARLFNTIGPRQSAQYGMVVPTFVQQALAGEPITIHGDGTQRRCFVHVGDVVEALIAVVDSDRHAGETFNIGHTDETSILALAKLVRELTGARSELAFVPYERVYAVGIEDTPRRVPDITKIAAATGWMPRRALAQAIGDVISGAASTTRSSSSPARRAEALRR